MLMNNLAIFDFETGSKNPLKCQPTQLAAVIVDVRKLQIIENSTFQSYIQPEFEVAKCDQLGVDPLQDEAMKITGISIDTLKDAPGPKVVWGQFIEYLKGYNLKGISGGEWDSVILGGFNIIGYDNIICRRLCEQYGPKLKENGSLSFCHPIITLDVLMLMHTLFNGAKICSTNSMSFDNIRDFFGYKKEGAHDACVDVFQTADLLIRILKLNRNLVDGKINLPVGKRIRFKGCVGGKI